MTTDSAKQSYARRANEYIDALGSIDALEASARATSLDRDLIGTWARQQPDGQLLDVGCGPGHWTNWLHEQGIDVAGVDPVPEFIRHAQDSYPDISFRTGRAEQLDVADSGLVGILAWYSLIHMPPDRITDVLAEFGRSIEPGGGLLVGFFEGPEVLPFDHAITTAYFWPLDLLSRKVEEAGFAVTFRRRWPPARCPGGEPGAAGPTGRGRSRARRSKRLAPASGRPPDQRRGFMLLGM